VAVALARIVTMHYRYKRLPRKQKAAPLDVPVVVRQIPP
jgi:hypothetical protein